ncbi:UNVERIFIED_CONTAM: peptidoglycan glycosyltransferase [Williamsia faeni]
MSNGPDGPNRSGWTTDNGDARQSAPAGRSPVEKKRTWQKVVAWILGLGGALLPGFVVVMAAVFLFTYADVAVPAPGDIKQSQVATVVDSNGGEIARIVPAEGNRTDVPIEEIPPVLQEAVMAAEDREFEQNAGFSISGYGRAVMGKITGNESAGGGSTITQQYVKNVLTGDEASYQRKFRELAISTKMANEWSKPEIMAAYLNTIYFGRGAYGVAAASKAYFNKDIKDITLPEAAVLASSIRSPSYYDPATNLEAAQGRWQYVLDGMVSTGAITKDEAAAQQYPNVVDPQAAAGDPASDGPNGLIKRQVLAELGGLDISEDEIRTGGLKITTTIDPKVQNANVQAANGSLDGEPKDLRTAVVSVDPQTGAVKGYFGGNDGNGYDYAQADLQTGSSFKVFAMVAALEQGIPLSKTYNSAPFENAGITITNSDGESCGTCNLATAMKMSLNTVFYRLMMDLNGGPNAVADAAHQAGIPETRPDGTKTLQNDDGGVEGGVVLGQYTSRVIDMASAYATLAASGTYHTPHFVQKVENSKGDVLFERTDNQGERRLPAEVADNTTAALEPIAAYSRGNALDGGERPSAAKTGTTQLGDTGMNKDAWMVGYTPQLSTAVWVGTDNGTELVNYAGSTIYGSGLPAQIWRTAMNSALDGQPIVDFPKPAAVGGVSGVPYETPTATSTTATRTTPPTTTTEAPTSQPGVTLAPGIVIPLPGGQGETTESAPDTETEPAVPSDEFGPPIGNP